MTALDLPQGELSEAMRAYFAKCDEKIGFVPNVLRAYAHDNAKLEALAAFYNDLMLAAIGPVEARTGDDHGRRVEPEPLLLLPHRPRRRSASSRRSRLGELLAMNHRAADLAPRHQGCSLSPCW